MWTWRIPREIFWSGASPKMRAESVVLEIFTSERCRKRKSLPELRQTRKKAIERKGYITSWYFLWYILLDKNEITPKGSGLYYFGGGIIICRFLRELFVRNFEFSTAPSNTLLFPLHWFYTSGCDENWSWRKGTDFGAKTDNESNCLIWMGKWKGFARSMTQIERAFVL